MQGRRLDDDDTPTVDVISIGLANLAEGDAIDNYNSIFRKLQERRRITPVWDEDRKLDHCEDPTSATLDGTPSELEVHPNHDIPSTELGDSPNAAVSDDEEGETESEAMEGDEPTLELSTFEDISFDMDSVEIEDDEGVNDEELDDITVDDVLGF